MKTDVLTPQAVFYLPQRLVVPLFQRPYVWEAAEQWLPLWQDIARLAGMRVRDPYGSPTHFLGAVVLQALEVQHGAVPEKNVVDGQQRLTTLQLLIDAAAAIFEERGLEALAQQLDDLTHNRAYGDQAPATLKLVHTNQDGAAFREVMASDPPLDHGSLKHATSRIVRAHAFFVERVEEWLGNGDDAPQRAEALARAISQSLQIVVIDLQASENSQEIFETLNARGTPLTAADLIKNFVFQRLEAEGADTKRAYAEDWPFETKFWEQDVSVGRVSMSRSSLFLNQWLGSRLGEEVSPKQTFVRFKSYVDHEAGLKMSELLLAIKDQAEMYKLWTENAMDQTRILTRPELAFYRMQAGGVEVLKPAIIWLYDPEVGLPAAVADEVVAMLESWMVRRQLLRLTSADLGRIVADIISANRKAPSEGVAERVRSYLTRLDVASTYWPGDAEVRDHLLTEQVYSRYRRGRLRMCLEAAEDHLRGKHGYPTVPRMGYPVEHVLPQKWQIHWPVEGLEAELARSEHVHRLGNLTLLTTSLNSAVSNGPWRGDPGKREQILAHDVLLLNRHFSTADTWDEAAIVARTEQLTDLLLQVWPVPEGHLGEIKDPQTKEETWIELKHLVAAGLLPAGTVLHPRPGQWESREGIVTPDGQIEVDSKLYPTPSNAGFHVKGGKSSNGWKFWHLEDGRPLDELRALYRGTRAEAPRGFDWSGLHQILESLPPARWTTYGELADAIGTAPQPLGGHITRCRQCSNAWRVLGADGRVAPGFSWADPSDGRNPAELLLDDGIVLDDGIADPGQRIDAAELKALIVGDG